MILAILSYIQAKKGLFNPLRAEIFKSQFEKMKEFLEIYGVINSQEDLENSYSLDNLKIANIYNLFFEYEILSTGSIDKSYKENYLRLLYPMVLK